MDPPIRRFRIFGKQQSLHDLLGGGIAADVMLWRRRNVPIVILLGALAAWMLFYVSGYTFLSFASKVLLLLLTVLFIWAKAAAVLNRPPPPIPKMNLSKEAISEAAVFVGSYLNKLLSMFEDIALGKDPKLFYRVAFCLWLTSIIGGLTDLITLGYTGLVVVLTIPVLIEKYEDCIDRYMMQGYVQVQTCQRVYKENHTKVKNWITEKKKLI
ncbi:reticulon-like protein B12 [Ananas comosus]|uniref:Reticulon-like protein n=2 Tax=Ananas comosus TaxID=4615 RepID=A0A6P5GY76_ANACO|nr:reticulon-like protein B12 [Ananas comosus]